MASQYDLLIIDLDGTLLNSDGSVSVTNRRALDAARAEGIEVIIATGRAMVESRHALDAIEHDGLLIAAGGSLLCDTGTGRTMQRRVMPPDLVNDVTHALLGHGHKVLILKDSHATGYDYLAVGPGRLDPASEWWFNTIPAAVRYVEGLHEDEHPAETVRAGVVASSAELTPIARDLQRELGGRAFLQHWAAVTESEATGSSTHLLEVFNPNVSKWTMAEMVCRERGIDPTRVVAIGDGLNDVEIIANAGLGIAMANADHRVLNVADRLTGRHDEDGVAQAIDNILEGKW